MNSGHTRKRRLLALTVPGGFSGSPDAILNELAKYCEITCLIDGLWVPRPRRLRLALRTFRPQRRIWGQFYYTALQRYIKNPKSLMERIRHCERELGRVQLPYDVIFQFGALFGAINRPRAVPYVVLIDFTTRMAEKYFPPWAPSSSAEREAWNLLEKDMYHGADLVLVTTDFVLDSLVKDYEVSADKVAVVGWGAHVDLTEDFAKPTNYVLAFAGHDFDRHGGQAALKIFEAIREQLPDASLQTLTDRPVRAKGVEHLGILPKSQFAEILKNAAVLLLPGCVGGFQAVTEAMSAKCLCVVAEENPHMRGLIKHGETGLTFPLVRPTETVNQIVECLQDPNRLHAIGENARRHVLQHCLWPQVVSRMWREVERQFAAR